MDKAWGMCLGDDEKALYFISDLLFGQIRSSNFWCGRKGSGDEVRHTWVLAQPLFARTCEHVPFTIHRVLGVKGSIRCYGFHAFPGCFDGFVTQENVLPKVATGEKEGLEDPQRSAGDTTEFGRVPPVRSLILSFGEMSLLNDAMQSGYLKMTPDSILL